MNIQTLNDPGSPKEVRVFLVDDHPIVRNGLRMLLIEEPGLEWTGESAGGDEALTRIDEIKPDVVLMDFKLEGMDGLQMAEAIKSKHPEIAVIIITGYGNEILLAEALQKNVSGFITKDSSKDLISNAIKTAASGGTVWDPGLLYASVAGLGHMKKGVGVSRVVSQIEIGLTKSGFDAQQFSAREIETIALLSKGMPNKQIAATIGVSLASAKKYVSDIMAKLGADNRTTAAVMATKFLEQSRAGGPPDIPPAK